MKYFYLSIFILLGITTKAQNVEVQSTIEHFFEAFHAKDTLKLKSICSSKIILQSIQENSNNAELSDESASEFYKSIALIPKELKFQEKIMSYSIQVDGTMAHVWTPYEFYLNDTLSHKGVNAFTLFKENDVWRIIYVIDTRRK